MTDFALHRPLWLSGSTFASLLGLILHDDDEEEGGSSWAPQSKKQGRHVMPASSDVPALPPLSRPQGWSADDDEEESS